MVGTSKSSNIKPFYLLKPMVTWGISHFKKPPSVVAICWWNTVWKLRPLPNVGQPWGFTTWVNRSSWKVSHRSCLGTGTLCCPWFIDFTVVFHVTCNTFLWCAAKLTATAIQSSSSTICSLPRDTEAYGGCDVYLCRDRYIYQYVCIHDTYQTYMVYICM